jgi:hypothetical protein
MQGIAADEPKVGIAANPVTIANESILHYPTSFGFDLRLSI